jgi:succinoglycan biosynthesis transport protein ExoP
MPSTITREEKQAPPVPAKKTEGQLSLVELYRTFARRRMIILIFLVLGIIVGILYALRRPTFTATGILRVDPGRSSAYESSPLAGLSGDGDVKISAEVAVLKTQTVLAQVAETLNLSNESNFISWSGKEAHRLHSLRDPEDRDVVLARLEKSITIARGPRDEIVTISCTTYSPTLSAKIVNTLTSIYIDRVFQMRFGTANRVTAQLIGTLDGLRDQVQSDQLKLVDLQQKLGIIGVDAKDTTLLSTGSLETLTRASTDATVARIVSEARLRYLKGMNPNLIESETPLLQVQGSSAGSLLQTLRAQQATAEATYARLMLKYDVNYPTAKQAKAELDALNSQIRQEEDRILGQANVAFQAADANEKMTQQTLDSHEKKAFSMRDEIVRYIILQRDYESHRELYEGLTRHLREAGIDAGMQSADVDILDVAEVPVRASGLGKLLSMVAGLIVGLFIGVGAALIIDLLDSRLSDPEEASTYLNIPVITALPLVKASAISVIDMPTSAYAEGMQLMRNSLLLSTVGGAPKTILVTSAIPGEGKSTTSRNLAFTFALHNSRVLLIDADLRRPVQHKVLNVSGATGLSTVLSSSVDIESCITSLKNMPNMNFLPAGPVPPNPAILLGSARMRTLMEELTRTYDVVIIDSAPVSSTTDTLLFAQEADACLLVVRQNKAHRQTVGESKELLQRAGVNLIGFVMNCMNYNAGKYYYYYGKGSGYGSYQPSQGDASNG